MSTGPANLSHHLRRRRRGGALAAIAGALAAVSLSTSAGCATFKSDTTVCPEYRDLRCATAPECSMDERRGCRVCACSQAGEASREGRLPSGVAPDRRTPAR